jgi:hypothetical protein
MFIRYSFRIRLFGDLVLFFGLLWGFAGSVLVVDQVHVDQQCIVSTQNVRRRLGRRWGMYGLPAVTSLQNGRPRSYIALQIEASEAGRLVRMKSKPTTANSADSSSVEVDTTDYRKLYTVRKIAGTQRESLERESMPGLSPEKEATRGLDHLMFAPGGLIVLDLSCGTSERVSSRMVVHRRVIWS